VSVDGAVVRELGTKVTLSANIEVDGQSIRLERPVYLALHKPKGYVSTNNDPAGRPRVVDLVGEISERVYSVGRLDEDSTGLMILTNDGDMANRLAHPRFGVEKVYRVLVAGRPGHETIDALMKGVWLSDGKARARRARVLTEQGEATLIELVLAEGKNREVRRMLAKLGHKVMRLTRVAIGPVSLRDLKPGQWRHLTSFEVAQLRRLAQGESVHTAGVPAPERQRPSQPRRGPARHAATPTKSAEAAPKPPGSRLPRVPDARNALPPSQRKPSGRPPRPGLLRTKKPQPIGEHEHEIEIGPWTGEPQETSSRRPPGRRSRSAPPVVPTRKRTIIGHDVSPSEPDGPPPPRARRTRPTQKKPRP
jgi:23S rRNA pseudouridine2605 synthase